MRVTSAFEVLAGCRLDRPADLVSDRFHEQQQPLGAKSYEALRGSRRRRHRNKHSTFASEPTTFAFANE